MDLVFLYAKFLKDFKMSEKMTDLEKIKRIFMNITEKEMKSLHQKLHCRFVFKKMLLIQKHVI